jgi:hypothetical protein
MATRIVFTGGDGEKRLSVSVEENLDGVFDAWRSSAGMPFALTKARGENEQVWVNPGAVAYWETAQDGPATFHQPMH